MTTQRFLLLGYIVLGVLIALALQHLFGAIGNDVAWLGFLSRTVFGTEMFWALIAGFALSGGVAIYCWVSPRVRGPAIQVIEELQRVTWPTFQETRTAAIAVIIATAVCAVLLGAFDYGWGYVTKQIYAEAAGTSQSNQNP